MIVLDILHFACFNFLVFLFYFSFFFKYYLIASRIPPGLIVFQAWLSSQVVVGVVGYHGPQTIVLMTPFRRTGRLPCIFIYALGARVTIYSLGARVAIYSRGARVTIYSRGARVTIYSRRARVKKFSFAGRSARHFFF